MQDCDGDGVSIALPYADKAGHAQIVFVPVSGQTTTKVVNVSGDYQDFQTLTFSRDANLLAAASQDGTLLRVIDVATGDLVSEVCRGKTAATISSLCICESESNPLEH